VPFVAKTDQKKGLFLDLSRTSGINSTYNNIFVKPFD